MPILQTQTTSFKKELYEGVHALTTDTLMIALYTANANLTADTTVYSPEGEVAGEGYTPGGMMLTGVTVAAQDGVAYVNFADVEWNPAAFTARGALIYNASKSNYSIAVLDFGADKTATTAFKITMPVTGASTALIRSA